MNRLMYIKRLALAVMLLLLLALAPAMAQTFVRTGETTPLAVEQKAGDTYSWDLYNDPNVDFATTSGNCPITSANFVGGNVGASVNVKWMKAGFYFYRMTARDATDCTNNVKVGTLEVKIAVKAVITPPDKEICVGDSISLEVTLTGDAPWNFTYTATDIDGGILIKSVTNVTDSIYTLKISPSPIKTTNYTIIKVSDIYGTNTEPSNTVTQIVNPLPDPSKIYHR